MRHRKIAPLRFARACAAWFGRWRVIFGWRPLTRRGMRSLIASSCCLLTAFGPAARVAAQDALRTPEPPAEESESAQPAPDAFPIAHRADDAGATAVLVRGASGSVIAIAPRAGWGAAESNASPALVIGDETITAGSTLFDERLQPSPFVMIEMPGAVPAGATTRIRQQALRAGDVVFIAQGADGSPAAARVMIANGATAALRLDSGASAAGDAAVFDAAGALVGFTTADASLQADTPPTAGGVVALLAPYVALIEERSLADTRAARPFREIRRGNAAFRAGEFGAAAARYARVVASEEDGLEPEALHNQAAAEYRLGQLDEARELWVRAKDRRDAAFESRAAYNLGLCHYEAAWRIWEGVQLDPMRTPRDRIQAALNKLGEASEYFESAIQLNAAASDARANLELTTKFRQELIETLKADCNENEIPDRLEIAAETATDCNRNGVPDTCDIESGASEDCDENGVPDECDDCNENGNPDTMDVQTGASKDCNRNCVPDECEDDCNENGVPDDCDIRDGVSADCNENGLPDECETDCNQNGVPDDCDIRDGTSADCDKNRVPDECDDCNQNGVPDVQDIEQATSKDCNVDCVPDECQEDCNENGVPDDCDIAEGVSIDCNGNGIPDECEDDCNNNDIPDDCDIRDGTSGDCDRDGVPDECQDCNRNGVPDAQDVAMRTSQDCDDNCVPDECEPDCNENGVTDACDIRDGVSKDCNENKIPDECDIRDGTSQDADGDGVPDECQSDQDQQDQQDQQQQQDQQDQQDQQQDQSEDQQGENQPQNQEGDNPEDQGQPQPQEGEGQSESDPGDEQSEPQAGEQSGEQSGEGADEGESAATEEGTGIQPQLTPSEVERLLQLVRDREKQRRDFLRRLAEMRTRSQPVDKDW